MTATQRKNVTKSTWGPFGRSEATAAVTATPRKTAPRRRAMAARKVFMGEGEAIRIFLGCTLTGRRRSGIAIEIRGGDEMLHDCASADIHGDCP